jgi:hypothetical protein
MGSIFKTLPHRCLDATYGVGVCGYTMALGVWSVYQPPPGQPPQPPPPGQPPQPPGPPGPPPDELPIVVIVLDGVKVLSSEPPVIVPLIDQYNHSSVGLEIVPPCHTLYVLFFTISGHDRSSVAPLLVDHCKIPVGQNVKKVLSLCYGKAQRENRRSLEVVVAGRDIRLF